MFKTLKKNKAQIFSEYSMTVMIIISVVLVMSIFIKRLIQARIKGAEDRLYSVVSEAHLENENNVGEVLRQYEPYYVNTTADVRFQSDVHYRLLEGGVTGIANKIIDQATNVVSTSSQLPITEAD